MILGLYRVITSLGGPLIAHYLERRKAQGKEDPQRFPERLGIASRPRPAGPLVWLHAASVGESVSMLPVIERLLERPEVSVLVTTGTVTSAGLMAQRLPPRALHQYVPVDRLAYVRRFLDHWKPDLALWAESEFWPNLLTETADRGVPLVLLNGRVSDKSFRSWRRFSGFARRLLSGFALALGQTQLDAERLAALGAPRTACVGNLKFATPPLPADDTALAKLRAAIGTRPVWLAASTHAGEEEIIGRVHIAVTETHPHVLTIIVPRHPQRGPAVAQALRDLGLTISLRSAGDPLDAATAVYVADTMGELGLFYRAAPIAFVGKSLGASGGQNPLEPARLGRAVLFGPHMTNFAEIAHRLMTAGVARQVADEADLARAVHHLLSQPGEAAAMGAKAQAFATAEAGVLDAVLSELAPFLDRLGR